MIHISASPDQLTDEGRAWLERDRIASAFIYACHQSEQECRIRKRGADAAFHYLCTRHRRKVRKVKEPKEPYRGIGWYLAWPFAALCGWIPLVPVAAHENDHEP